MRLFALLVTIVAAAALAQEADAGALEPIDAGSAPSEPTPVATTSADAPTPTKTVDVTGYVSSRSSFSRSRATGFIPTDDMPQLQELLEFNTQLRVTFRPRSFVYADVSLIGNAAGNYRGSNAEGAEVVVAEHKTQAATPIVSVNELYLFHEFFPALNLTLGKKRVVWGPGQAVNPTDFLNARRDPTDPTLQRAGVWLAELEVPLETMTFSVLFAPTVLSQTAGIPTQFLAHPSWDQKDTQLHYQLAARMYALVANTDLNVMLFYGNRSTDDFEKKVRAGLSFSHVFFEALEVHGEALIQSGSTRDVITSSCVTSAIDAFVCGSKGTALLTKPRLTSPDVLPKTLLGARYQFSDDSMVSLEYLWQADGWTGPQFDDFGRALGLAADAKKSGLALNGVPGVSALLGGPTTTDGTPTRLAFDPRGQHYLFATFQKPRLFDDFTAQLTVIANARDLSTMWSPSISWSTTESLTLTLLGFVPAPGPDAIAPKTAAGAATSEYGVTPFVYRLLFEARLFY